MPPSSRGLGHLPFTEETGIRIPLGVNDKRTLTLCVSQKKTCAKSINQMNKRIFLMCLKKKLVCGADPFDQKNTLKEKLVDKTARTEYTSE